ncbi:MAG TPA: sigma-70 family RNA polymerase sigma factor [Candidatus Acidoferrum sp.]
MTKSQLTTIDSLSTSISSMEIEGARRTALEELYARYSTLLYKVALRKLGNPADAEDALQDGLLSAFKHFDQFKGESQISTWLTSIVLNAARMQLRRRSCRHFVSLDEPDNERSFARAEILVDAGPDPEEIFRRTQVKEVLERFEAKLSPKIRLAFRLRILEGLTTREAAERMGISEGTLKAQFFRARRQIAPLIRRALGSPAKSRKRSRHARVRELIPQGVALSPEQSPYRRVA